MLLEEEESGNGMRTKTDEARHPTTESPCQAFLAADITQKTNDALTTALRMRSRHNASLDHVHRAADSGSNEARHERGCEVCAQIISHASLLNTQALECIVRSELRGSHEDCAGGVRPHSAEERTESLCSGHLNDSLDCVSVVAALGGREGCIVLHADVHNIGWVSCNAADESGGGGHANEGDQAWCAV